MIDNPSFVSFEEQHGLLFDDSAHEQYPIRYYCITKPFTATGNSWYLFCYEGAGAINQPDEVPVYLVAGMYASLKGEWCIEQNYAGMKLIAIEVLHDEGVYPETNFRAMRMIGGKVEPEGRLKYIDGCTDSLLIPPVKLGDPCLNHLHFPPNIDQTPHTHPSHRIGIVASGNGECITPFGNVPLTPGMIFIIKAQDGKKTAKGLDGKKHLVGTHCFRTFGEPMDVIAFHPDSDFGPTDVGHPMINRTIVDGRSANELEDIQTK